jgi:hypothetical protein
MTATVALGPLRIDPDQLGLHPPERDPDDFPSALPVQHDGLIAVDERIGLAVGVRDTTTIQAALGPHSR